MNRRENLLAMLRGQNPERLPFFISLTQPASDELKRRTGSEDVVSQLGSDIVQLNPDFGENPATWEEAYAANGISLPANHEILRVGITVAYPENPGAAYHLAQIIHTLKDFDDIVTLERLPWPEPCDQRHYAGVEEQIATIKKQGLVSMLNLTCTIFEDSWYMRGMDNLVSDLMEENEVGCWILDYMTRRSVEVAKAYARAGVDIIWLGDDIGMQQSMLMSPDFWRTHFKPRLQKVIDAARTASSGELFLMYHSDGNIKPVISELFEMGIDILNPVQPECMDVEEILTRYRDKGAFLGMIGTQSTMPNGHPDEVRAAVAQLRRLAADGIRIVCAPTHVIEPDVPWDNIMALAGAPRNLRIPLHQNKPKTEKGNANID
jgi:uroporphyrinogen decarboxylase